MKGDRVPQWCQYLLLKNVFNDTWSVALRSGITVASEVYPRRGYCWLKTFPNTPQDDLKYSRLCNFCWSTRGPINNKKRISFQIFRHLCLTDKNDYRSQQYTLHNVICDNHCFAKITICRQKVEDWTNLEVRSVSWDEGDHSVEGAFANILWWFRSSFLLLKSVDEILWCDYWNEL